MVFGACRFVELVDFLLLFGELSLIHAFKILIRNKISGTLAPRTECASRSFSYLRIDSNRVSDTKIRREPDF